MSSTCDANADVLIIGGGLFGLTTAFALAEGKYAHDPSRILVIDRSANPPELDAASSDINKITRGGEYANKTYSDLGVRSIDRWINDPFWAPYFYKSGIIIASSEVPCDGAQSVKASYELLEELHKDGITPAPPVNIDDDTGYRGALRAPPEVKIGSVPSLAYFNAHCGWSAARSAMLAVAARCRALGVRFHAGLVDSLIIETTASGSQDVRGVRLIDPSATEILTSDLVILAAGSWSASIFPEVATNVLATGQVIATVELTPEEYEQYKDAPVYLDFRNDFYVFPPTPERIVKFAIHAIGYTNAQEVALAGKESVSVSVPRTKLYEGSVDDNIPRAALAELRTELGKVWPNLAKKPVASTRICWYSDTADSDWLISYHDKYPSLFLATGDSGHAFKFAPIIGELCVQAIEGKLPQLLEETWSITKNRVKHSRFTGTSVQGILDKDSFATTEDLLQSG